jgi:hypothetical protein
MKQILAAVCLAHVLVTCGFALCHAPKYRQGLTLVDSKSEAVANISIDLKDFTPSKLSCLAGILNDRYRGRKRITVSIFSSPEAATHSMAVLPPEPTKVDYERLAQLHAYYLYDAETREDYIVLMPDPMIGNPNAPTNTKINLTALAAPACKLEINNRCLLKFQHIRLTGQDESGSITLSARIERNGSVSSVRVIDGNTNPSSPQHALAYFALQNLKSWHFERSQHEDAIKIVYSLEHVDRPLEHGENVEFMLPDKVRIQIGSVLLAQ